MFGKHVRKPVETYVVGQQKKLSNQTTKHMVSNETATTTVRKEAHVLADKAASVTMNEKALKATLTKIR